MMRFAMVLLVMVGCSRSAEEVAVAEPAASRVGVLLVSHGSRSARWREMLLDVEERVEERVLANGDIESMRSAFMEYTEPSIATQLEAFDDAGYSDVIVVPLLLTVSSHSFDDIPTIAGQRSDAVSLERLRTEGTRIYEPRAHVHMTALLDFSELLRVNVHRRVAALSTDVDHEAVVLVAYGSQEYDEEWTQLVGSLGTSLRTELGVDATHHAWCGHLVHYESEPTKNAILGALENAQRALVVPVLVAVDEMFQEGNIQTGVDQARAAVGDSRVVYRPDAILPEPTLDDWVVHVTQEHAGRIVDRP